MSTSTKFTDEQKAQLAKLRDQRDAAGFAGDGKGFNEADRAIAALWNEVLER